MKKSVMFLMLVLGLALTGCGQKAGSTEQAATDYRTDLEPQELVEAVAAELGEEYWADTEIPPEYMESTYGIESDMYEGYYGQIPMVSVHVDSLLVVKAADGQADVVEDSLNAYREYLVNESMQYPMNLAKVQACQTKTYGNYVCFAMLGGTAGSVEDDEEQAVKACQEANAQAFGIIEAALKK